MAKHPQWALRHKRKGTEIRFINGSYYLYKITSKWDPEKKRSKKITLGLLGKITEKDGFIESEKHKLKQQQKIQGNITVKEYGISFLITNKLINYVDLLKKHFPDKWKFILALSYCRFAYQSPLKNCPYLFQKSYLSEDIKNAGLSSSMVSKKLKELGLERKQILNFFKEFKVENDSILFDGTDMFSQSKKMSYPHKSKTKKGTFDDIVNVMFVFSTKLMSPLYYRLLPGNIKDISSFKLCLNEAEVNDATVIADKGFYSKKNIEQLDNENIKYIIPLKRNSSLIDYKPVMTGDLKKFNGYFLYEKKIIWYYETEVSGKRLIIYKNDELKTQETKDYLTRCETLPEMYNEKDFFKKQYQFGTISLLSNIDKNINAQEIYERYKTRHQIENMIDVFKNIFEADKSYMQNDDAIEGWMFINFMVMHWYYQIIRMLQVLKLNNKYSPKDIILFLSNVKKVKINNKWYDSELTKNEKELFDKLKIHIV